MDGESKARRYQDRGGPSPYEESVHAKSRARMARAIAGREAAHAIAATSEGCGLRKAEGVGQEFGDRQSRDADEAGGGEAEETIGAQACG